MYAKRSPIIALIRIEAGSKVADACVRYGFCTSVCPTYVLDGDENDSPRGRITLIKAMLESERVPAPSAVTHVAMQGLLWDPDLAYELGQACQARPASTLPQATPPKSASSSR